MSRESLQTPLKPGLISLVGLSACIAAGIGVVKTQEPVLIQEFKHEYISHDGCLDGSEFDPSNGAKVTVSKINDVQVVNVRSGDTSRVIHLQRNHDGLQFADHISAAILLQNGCELPNGT